MTRHPLPGVLALLIVLTVMLTWPQALHLKTHVANHGDAFFNIWRLSWVAHALTGDIRHLFDANIFHPAKDTLAYSDAMLFEGLVTAPFLWARIDSVLVYNLMLLAGMVTSGLGMFVLVRSLTRNIDAALVSAVIFTLAPYRIEHYMHLELQWTIWMPLTFWAIHRAFDDGSLKHGALAGLFVLLQTLSSVYYGVFLVMIAAAQTALLAATEPGKARRAITVLATGAVVPGLLIAAYALPYMRTARVFGPREAGQIQTFSAHLDSYFTAPQQNWLWGWTAFAYKGDELHLFLGVVALLLAVLAFFHSRRRTVLVYAGLAVIAVILSLGSNGPYAWLLAHVPGLDGLRAPARFGILAGCAVAVLAGVGFEYLHQCVTAASARRAVLVAALVAIGVESGSAPMLLTNAPLPDSDVYRFLRQVYPSPVIELPVVEWNLEPFYMYWSRAHWNPLVNGYSGHESPEYKKTIKTMQRFPDEASIARLRELGVRYVLVHDFFFKPAERASLIVRMAQTPALVPTGRYRGPVGTVQIFELTR